MRVSEIASGSPAASLHPAIASTLSLPGPPDSPNRGGGATTLNAPVAAPNPAPGPPDSPNRGVPLPPAATPIATPIQNPPAAPLRPGDQQPGTTESAAPPPTQPAPGPPNLNFDDDPLFQQTKQQMAQQDSQSASETLANLQQILLAHGSRSLAQDYLEKINQDPDFARSLGPQLWQAFQQGEGAFLDRVDANGSPETGLGTVAKLAYQNNLDQRNQAESYNQGNLFFSGAHGSAIQQLARNYAIDRSTADQGVLGQLGTGRSGFLAALVQHAGTLSSAAQSAYDRKVNQALKYQTPGDSGASSGGSNGSGGSSGGSDAPPPKKAPPPMAGPPDDRARKGANPPAPAKDTRPKTVVYKGRH